MANCPKCGTHLSPFRWAPACPNCHVNIMYYDMEKRLASDADQAEAEAARFSRMGKRMKTVSVGSALAWARLVSFLLPILAALLPFGKARLLGLGIQEPVEISLITVVSGLMKGAGTMGAHLNATADGKILLGSLLLLGVALCALCGMIACVFSYSKGGKRTMLGLLIAGAAAALLSGVLLLLAGVTPGAGFYAVLGCFAICIALAKLASDKIHVD